MLLPVFGLILNSEWWVMFIRICFIKRVFLMCSLSCLRKTVQFINLFLELILSVCDHYHDPTSSPAYSSNVSVLFPLAPHPFTIHLGFLSVYLGAGLPARTFFILVLGSDPRCRGLNPLVPWAADGPRPGLFLGQMIEDKCDKGVSIVL